jgi:hypothetical protein
MLLHLLHARLPRRLPASDEVVKPSAELATTRTTGPTWAGSCRRRRSERDGSGRCGWNSGLNRGRLQLFFIVHKTSEVSP